jgi:geranylgeranyl diphosphate synthase type II
MPSGAQTDKSDLATMFAPTKAVEAYMQQVLDSRPLPTNLREAVRYALMGPGKRLRPILIVRSCEAVGGTLEQALPAAAAMEMIHCFSLVHDDLPAMDDDDLRRGRPTLHKYTNEAMAILGGDLMMGLAFEVLATRVQPAALAQAILAELALGTNDMIAGQVYDTLPDFDAATPPMQRLQTIHRHKTGALIRASCRIGGLSGGAGSVPIFSSGKTGTDPLSPALSALTAYGEAIGLMFQVVDDLLDVTQSTENLGKAAGKDADKGKLTYPGLIGIDASRKEIKRLQAEAHAALQPLGDRAQRLRELCDFMAVRQK